MRINAATPLEYYHGSFDELPANVTRCALLPQSSTSPGYDAVVRYPLASDISKYFEVFYKTNFTVEDRMTNTSPADLAKYHEFTMKEIKQCKKGTNCAGYTVVFNCWRNGGVTDAFESKLPKNCILLNKHYVERNWSSVIVNLLQTCDVEYSFDQKAGGDGAKSKYTKE